MYTSREVHLTQSARDASQMRRACRVQRAAAHGPRPSPLWVSYLCGSIIVGICLSVGARSAPAQSHHGNGALSQAAQNHLLLAPLPPLATMTTAVSPPPLFRGASLRFALFPDAHSAESFPDFPASGSRSTAALDLAAPADVAMSVATLRLLPLRAWVHDRASDALQFRISRFDALADSTPHAPLPLAVSRARLLSQPLTIVHVHGTWVLDAPDQGVVRYGLYAGVFAEETPRDLIVGTHIGYTVGATGFTLGIEYLYGPQAVALDVFGRHAAGSRLDWPGSGARVFGLGLLTDMDKLRVEHQLLHGGATHVGTPLAVHATPILHIDRQWAVFYRFDHLRLGRGVRQLMTHTFGVQFFLTMNVSLHAEYIVERTNVGGFRLAGTIRF